MQKEGAIILSTIGIMFLLFSVYQQSQKIDDLQQELKATNLAKKHPPKYVIQEQRLVLPSNSNLSIGS